MTQISLTTLGIKIQKKPTTDFGKEENQMDVILTTQISQMLNYFINIVN